jgi:hypothetical protein
MTLWWCTTKWDLIHKYHWTGWHEGHGALLAYQHHYKGPHEQAALDPGSHAFNLQ